MFSAPFKKILKKFLLKSNKSTAIAIPFPKTTNNVSRVPSRPSIDLSLLQVNPSNPALHTLLRLSRTALCHDLGLLSRDLRSLDSPHKLPVILVRERCLLIALDSYLRMIVKHDGLLMIEAIQEEEDRKVQNFLRHDLSNGLKNRPMDDTPSMDNCSATERSNTIDDVRKALSYSNALPFEFIVLEASLQRVLADSQKELDTQQSTLDTIPNLFEETNKQNGRWRALHVLLECRRQVKCLEGKINGLRDCLKELLDSDQDMSRMYLTERRDAPRPASAHEEIELLLESYLKAAEELASQASLLTSNLEATEDVLNIGLMGQRNDLILLELKIGIIGLGLSIAALGTSAFGMNLRSGLETQPGFFVKVLGLLSLTSLITFCLAWRRMSRLTARRLFN